jgi:genome maintenance exonuclease 1
MKRNDKYKYVRGTSTTDHGSRTYDFNGNKVPSVTTILSRTKDQSFLDKWRARIGFEEADRIFNHSAKRGTSMHKFIENHITGIGYDDLTSIGQEARPMAQKIIDTGLNPIAEYYGSEVTLHYPGLYAGSTDLICKHNGRDTIIDFKQSNKPKKEAWIEDYYMQIAAYAMAHDYVHHSNIEQGIIMVCTPDLYFQEFKFDGDKMRQYRHKFLERLSQYYVQNKA